MNKLVSWYSGAQRPVAVAYLALTLTALFFAANHVIGRGVHEQIPPVGLSFWRWVMGAVLLAPFVLTRPGVLSRVFGRHAGVLLLLGAMLVGSTTLILLALNSTMAINVSVINAIQPGLTVLFAWLFLKEPLTGKQAFGFGSACAGVLVMLSRGHWEVLIGLQMNTGDLITLLAMCGFAGYAVSLFRIPEELSFVESLFGIIVMGSLALLPFYLIESYFFATVPLSIGTLGIVFTLALLVSVLGMLMWNFGNHRVGPGRAVVFINLIPLFGVLLATTFLDESVQGFHAVGAVFIIVGIWLVVHKAPDKLISRKAPSAKSKT